MHTPIVSSFIQKIHRMHVHTTRDKQIKLKGLPNEHSASTTTMKNMAQFKIQSRRCSNISMHWATKGTANMYPIQNMMRARATSATQISNVNAGLMVLLDTKKFPGKYFLANMTSASPKHPIVCGTTMTTQPTFASKEVIPRLLQ